MKRIRTAVHGLTVLTALVGLSGCATVVGGWKDKEIQIATEPPGAAISVDGNPVGTTPATINLSRKCEHQITVSQPGYETAHFQIRRRLNPWVFGNIVVGGIVGAVVDVCTDATHTLSPDDIRVKLHPNSETAIQQAGK